MPPQHRITSRSRISAGVASLIIAMGMPLVGEHGLFQEPTSTPSQERAGIVMGHVYCGDTHQLARFANVIVQPLELPGSTGKDLRTTVETPTVTHTDLDGKFTVSDLLPGSYLVLAWLPGYVSPFCPDQDWCRTRTRLAGAENSPATNRGQESSGHDD
jgi:hypothetical protein